MGCCANMETFRAGPDEVFNRKGELVVVEIDFAILSVDASTRGKHPI